MSNRLAADAKALLFPALARLDGRIERALAIGPDVLGQALTDESTRGLCIDGPEIDRLLSRSLGEPLFGEANDSPDDEDGGTPANRLRALFGLAGFDVDVLAVALAPEIDLRYERIYAYLQDDVTRRRPTVNLALNLLCRTAAEKLERREHFQLESPLLRHGLVELVSDASGPTSPLLARTVQIDERLVGALTAGEAIDPRLAGCCELVRDGADWASLPIEDDVRRSMPSLTAGAWAEGAPLRFYFHGQRSSGKRTAARALAAALDVPLLIADLDRVDGSGPEGAKTVQRIFREATLLDALLYLTRFDALRAASSRAALESTLAGLERYRSARDRRGRRSVDPARESRARGDPGRVLDSDVRCPPRVLGRAACGP